MDLHFNSQTGHTTLWIIFTLECGNRKYGDGCQRNCGNCLNRAQCDHVIGTCLRCEAGYQGQMCDQGKLPVIETLVNNFVMYYSKRLQVLETIMYHYVSFKKLHFLQKKKNFTMI